MIIGSIALAYFTKKYANQNYIGICHDNDITLFPNETENDYKDVPKVDFVKKNKDILFTILPKLNVDQIEDDKYVSLEGLSLCYLQRPLEYNFKSIKDYYKLLQCKYLLKKKGTYKIFKNNFLKLGYNDYHLLFSYNNYFYRLYNFRNQNIIIGGEFALMVYYEYLLHKQYHFKSYDLELYNFFDGSYNYLGSKIIPKGNQTEYINFDGYKVVPLEILQKEYKFDNKLFKQLRKYDKQFNKHRSKSN